MPTSGMDEPPEHQVALVQVSSLEGLVSGAAGTTTTSTDNTTAINQQQLTTGPILLNTELLDPDCEAVLESIESCVGCVEGVDEQHDYEEKMLEYNRHKKAAIEQHGLSDAEAASIRLHVMDQEERDDRNINKKNNRVDDSVIPDMDILNLCGNDEDLDDAQDVFVINVTGPDVMSCADIVNDDLVLRKDTEVRDGIIMGQDINALTCAICFDEALLGGDIALNRVKFANLPCCGGRESTSTGNDKAEESSFIKVCTSCILVLSIRSTTGPQRIGRCPRCLDWIKVQIPVDTEDTTPSICNINNKNGVIVEKIDVGGQCLICNQEKDHLVENDEVCDSCFLGRRQPLKYECQQCLHVQNIPHPMYRYQETKDQFGNCAWACQGKCGKFSNWKILPEELHRIALGDAPKSWKTDYITVARNRVKLLREDLNEKGDDTRPPNNKASRPVILLGEDDPSQCLVL